LTAQGEGGEVELERGKPQLMAMEKRAKSRGNKKSLLTRGKDAQ